MSPVRTEDVPESLRATIALSEQLGIPISPRHSMYCHVYDGKTIALRNGILRMRYSCELLHEMAHHIVAPEYLRDVPEWGLMWGVADGGAHPDLTDNDRETKAFLGLLPEEEQSMQEAQAQVVSLLLAEQIGLDTFDYSPSESRRVTLSRAAYKREKANEWAASDYPQHWPSAWELAPAALAAYTNSGG